MGESSVFTNQIGTRRPTRERKNEAATQWGRDIDAASITLRMPRSGIKSMDD
tara:strand:+ start:437 stop:592 length:156 start_codon:yes stop_codon:yes gene_type:complete